MVEVNATVSREQLYRAAIDPDEESTVIHGTASEIVLDIEDDVEDLADAVVENRGGDLYHFDNEFSEMVMDKNIDELKEKMPDELSD